MSVSTSYIYKGKVKDPRYMQNKKDSRISLVKFIYSEKATKFCKISTVDLTDTI